MGLWQKTMFYLGLVDEDRVGFDEPETPRGRPEPRRQSTPAVEPSRPLVSRAARAPEPSTEPARPMRSRGAQPADEHMESSRVQVSPSSGPQRTGIAPRDPQVIRAGYPTVQGRRVEPPSAPRRRPMADRALTDAGVVVQSSDRPMRMMSGGDLESQVIVARSYNDAQVLADHIRASVPVVLDLRKVEPAMVRRLVDFSSGLTYALGGSMRKIGQGVVLVTPANVNISRDERRRLTDLGYYQALEEG